MSGAILCPTERQSSRLQPLTWTNLVLADLTNDTRGLAFYQKDSSSTPGNCQVTECVPLPDLPTASLAQKKSKRRKRKRHSATMWDRPKPQVVRKKGRYHEKQRLEFCGVHAINNALGKKVLTPLDANREVATLGPLHGHAGGKYSIVATGPSKC